MNENDARDLLLVQAFEQTANAAWSAEDRRWANDAATRKLGEQAAADTWLLARARLAASRLRERNATARGLNLAARWPDGLGWIVAAAALLVGIIGAGTGSDRFINLLAPPLLGLLAWNLAVYAGLVLMRLSASPTSGRSPFARLVALALALRQRSRLRHGDAGLASVASHFANAWAAASANLTAARVAHSLHLAAALLACGAIIGLYLRGLVFEYRAGWASTFLAPEQVAALARLIFAPASLLAGIELPDAARLAAMRIPPGSGERAGDWIHLQAVTLVLFVIAPRLALAWLARRQARHHAMALPVAAQAASVDPTLRARPGAGCTVLLIPYAAQPDEYTREHLAGLFGTALGASTTLQIAANVPYAALAEEIAWPASTSAEWCVVLFRLAATPEREIQLQFVDELRSRLDAGTRLALVVDETSFRARFDDVSRLEQRRRAWQRLFDELDGVPLIFISLTAASCSSGVEALARGLAGSVVHATA